MFKLFSLHKRFLEELVLRQHQHECAILIGITYRCYNSKVLKNVKDVIGT